MKIIRYSETGFFPQKQTHHLKHIHYHLSDEFKLEDYPEFMRLQIQKIHEQKVLFYEMHMDDFKSGIWCFIDGHKDNLSLNHLQKRVPCWEAEIPDDTECYDCNWETLTTVNNSVVLYGGCYIPERELHKIKNIKRRRKKIEQHHD